MPKINYFIFFFILSCSNRKEHKSYREKIISAYLIDTSHVFYDYPLNTGNEILILFEIKEDTLKLNESKFIGYLQKTNDVYLDPFASLRYNKRNKWMLDHFEESIMIKRPGYFYLKGVFSAINPQYHSLKMVYDTHKEILMDSFKIFIFDQFENTIEYRKSDTFKIQLFREGNLVQPNDTSIMDFW